MYDKLLKKLNETAIDINYYEYGLPLYHEQDMDRLRQDVANWLAEYNAQKLRRAHNIIKAFVRVGPTDNVIADAIEVLQKDDPSYGLNEER